MKNVFCILFAVFFWINIAIAGNVDDRLPATAPEPLKAQTRAMIQSGIPNDDAVKMTRAMLQNQFELQHMLQAQNIVMNAHQQGLPVKPITDKAYEGMVKQVRAAAIVRAMQNVRSRYAFAYSQAALLTQSSKDQKQLGNRLAASLSAGLNKEDAKRIMSQLQERAQIMYQTRAHALSVETLNMTRDMARLGVSSTETANGVSQALQQGYTAAKMKQIHNSFMSQARHGAANDFAKSYFQALRNGQGTPLPGVGHGGSGGQGVSGSSGAGNGPGGRF